MNIRYNKLFLRYIIAGLIICSTVGIGYAKDGAVSTVRVGYYENEVFQEGANPGAVKTGYAYEYYRKISEYTGWKYEYIYGSYGDLYKMLLDGQIDLLAGLAWKKDREGLIGYPQTAMGNETYSLVKHDTDTDVTARLSSLNNKTIGVLDSAMVDVLAKFLLGHNIKANIITFQGYNELFEAFDTNKITILAAEGDGAYKRDNSEVICQFGTSDYYLCVNIHRPDLLEKLDEAQSMMMTEEPNYINSLRMKYYPISVSSRAFSAVEKQWMATHNRLNIGCLNHYMPYSSKDHSGNITGLVHEVVPTILQRLGIENIDIHYKVYENYNSMVAGMDKAEVDVIFPVGGGLYYSEENGIYQSNPVATSLTELVCDVKFSDAKTDTANFAVNKNNNMQYYYIKTKFPNARITLCNSIEECLDMVVAGKADCTTINGLRSEILKNRKYRHLSSRQLNTTDNRCFGVEIGNEGLLKILNRGINIIGTDYIQNIAYRYIDALYHYSFIDFVRDNIGILGSVMLILTLLIIFILVRDSRRSKAALYAAQHASRAKTVFLNNMSHDIRTPMNAIVGFTTLAQNSLDDKEKLNDYLSKIVTSSQHLLSLINDVLDMSRIESGKVTINEAEVCLPLLIKDLETIIQTNLTAKHQHLTVNVSITHQCVISDKLRLNQILLNILSNAIKFTPDGGNIILDVTESSSDNDKTGLYTFRIKDNGIGISEEFRNVIFEMFTREKNTTVSGIQGTGLGMAITKNIVDMLGGTIKVDSEEGQGSVFTVTIPCKICETHTEETVSEEQPADFTGKRVLLAEDVDTNQMIATALLEEVGFEVDIAADGVEAVNKMKNAAPNYYDIVLMDIQMPNMDGYEAARQIRALSDSDKANIPIVAVTANAFGEDRDAALAAGMNAHLAKPYDMQQIIIVLKDLLLS